MITVDEKIKEAGFKNKAEFARFFGLDKSTPSKWGDNPPIWVHYVLDMRIELKRVTGDL